jgi:predicted small lipoprotein YifL
MIRSALLAALIAMTLTACGEKPAEEMPVIEEAPIVEEAPMVEEVTEAPVAEEVPSEEVPAAE